MSFLKRMSPFAKGLFVFLLTYGAFFAKYPKYILSPNSIEFLANGDPMVTFYDMIYHVKYDDSFIFKGMNYPRGELIFMTDANGAFATVMRWINDHLFTIEHYVPGIFLSIVFLLFGICGVLMYRILRFFEVEDFLAILLAVFITYLSPQILRTPFHFSLSFPFIIPFGMWWIIRKYRSPGFDWTDVVFVPVLFFFFMNNAYVGFITSSFVAVTGLSLILFNRRQNRLRRAGIKTFLIPIVITLLVYLSLHSLDIYDDRLKLQWGFFYYHTKWLSWTGPKYSLMSHWFLDPEKTKSWSIEWVTYFGIVPLLMLVSYFLYWIVKRFKPLEALFPKHPLMSAFWASALVLLVYAMNTTLVPIQNSIEPYMGKLTMFRSSGRFAWPLYYVLAIYTAKILQAWYYRLNRLNRLAGVEFLILALGLYGYDAYYYVNHLFKGKDSPGYFTESELVPYKDAFRQNNIDTVHYQAIFALPLLEGWNEKVFTKVYNRTERGALVTSVLTGIPMINGRLSRNSTRMTLLATQMSSHPWIKKEAIEHLRNEKPLLIIQGTGSDDWLSTGEKWLKTHSRLVYQNSGFELRALPLDTIRQYKEYREAQKLIQRPDSTFTPPAIRLSFDDETSPNPLFGKGSHTTPATKYDSPGGVEVLLDTTFNSPEEQKWTFTAWSEVTTEKYGMPVFIIEIQGPDGKKHVGETHSRTYKDVFKNWIRSESVSVIPKGKVKLKLSVRTNQKSQIDEIEFCPQGDTCIVGYDSFDLLNNYPIEKNGR